jgi:hypothetical protein
LYATPFTNTRETERDKKLLLGKQRTSFLLPL